MLPPARSALFGLLFIVVCLCVQAHASTIPIARALQGDLAGRSFDRRTCLDSDVKHVINLLSKHSAVGKRVCDKVLKRPVSATNTIERTTQVTRTVTSTGTKTSTISKGTKHVIATKRVQKADIKTVTSTVVVTTTSKSRSTLRTTSVSTVVKEAPASTTTTTTTIADVGIQAKRSLKSFRERFPELPTDFKDVELGAASIGCLCWSKPQIVKTIFVTKKITRTKVVTAYKTKTLTVPKRTATSTKTVISTATSLRAAKVTSTSTRRLISTITTVATSTTTSRRTPSPVVETSTVTIQFSSQRNSIEDNCFLTGWAAKEALPVNNGDGLTQCANLCIKLEGCSFINAFAYSPDSNLGKGMACLLFTQGIGPKQCDASIRGSETASLGR